MSARRRAVAVALVVSALAACASWRRHHASSDLDTVAVGGPPRLFLTGDTAGFLAPCNCEVGQYGGLARRTTYLRRLAGRDDLRIDLGNLVTSASVAQRPLLRYSLEGLKAAGCDALVPGEGELRMGDAFVDACAAAKGPPVVCANLVRAGDGARVFDESLAKTLSDGRVVVVVGVAEPFAGLAAGWRMTPAEDAVRDVLARWRGKADAVVVATSMRDDAAVALAAKFPDVALVVGGWSSEGSNGVVKTAGAPAVLVGSYGWYVGRVDFDERLRVAGARQAWLDDGVPDDPETASLVARYKAEISQEGPDFATRLLTSLREQSFAGSAACAECHAAEHATWLASGHAHAMRTLVDKASQRNPDCVACHLVDVTPPPTDVDALGIGCEACHGGAARHVDLARRGSSDAAKALAPATRAACLRCHAPPNDTRFEFERNWPKIAHGRAAR